VEDEAVRNEEGLRERDVVERRGQTRKLLASVDKRFYRYVCFGTQHTITKIVTACCVFA
jgi:hypothetical protein